MSRVAQILTAKSPASEMRPQAEVRAVPGQGLEGDRYFSGTGTFSPPRQNPDFEITFIEQEKIEAVEKSESPNAEIRKKTEIRKPNQSHRRLRALNLFRISAFGFRIFAIAPPGEIS